MKRIAILLLVFIIAIGGTVSCASPSAEKSYKIGALTSQTGKYSGLGLQTLEGIQVIVEDINEKGGINGIPLELVPCDDKSSTTGVTLGAKKLIEVEKVDVILHGSTTALAQSTMPVADEGKTPAILLSGTALFDDQLGKWCFRPMGSEEDYVISFFQYLNEDLGITRVAALLENSGFGQGFEFFMPGIASKYNIEVVMTQHFDPTATDLTLQMTDIKNSNAQALVIWGSGPAGALAVKQARDMGINLPITASFAQGSPDMVKAFGAYYEMSPSLVVPASKTDIWQELPEDDPDKAMCQDFASLFLEKSDPPHPANFYNVLGAQLMLFVVDSLKRAQPDPTNVEKARSELRDALESTENLNLLTAVYTLSPEDHYGSVMQKIMLITFKDGGKILVPR